MPLEDSLNVLETRLRDAAQALENLLWAAVEAQPARGPGHALVDYYETTTTDALDHARQAVSCVLKIRRAPESRRGVALAARQMQHCTEHVGELAQCVLAGIGSIRRIGALERLSAERKGVWATWVRGVKDAIAETDESVGSATAALANCWQGLLGQVLPALSGPTVSATGARIILNGSNQKVEAETPSRSAAPPPVQHQSVSTDGDQP